MTEQEPPRREELDVPPVDSRFVIIATRGKEMLARRGIIKLTEILTDPQSPQGK
jgi:hypothetical protein